MGIKDLIFGQALMAHLFKSIGAIGNKLTNKNIPLSIERINNDI